MAIEAGNSDPDPEALSVTGRVHAYDTVDGSIPHPLIISYVVRNNYPWADPAPGPRCPRHSLDIVGQRTATTHSDNWHGPRVDWSPGAARETPGSYGCPTGAVPNISTRRLTSKMASPLFPRRPWRTSASSAFTVTTSSHAP